MYRSLGIGVILMILAVTATMIVNAFHYSIAMYAITGSVGGLSWVLAGMISGLFGRGDKIRHDYYRDPDDEYHRKQQISWKLFLVGLPNIVAAVGLYLIFQPR